MEQKVANDWQLSVPPGICVDVIPLRDKGWVARPYGLNDAFKGDLFHAETHWMGKPVADWFSAREIDLSATMRDVLAVRAGVNAIVNPTRAGEQAVQAAGLSVLWGDECCALY